MKPFFWNDRSRCAPQMRITRSISAMSGAGAGVAAAGFGWWISSVSINSATGAPTAVQSGVVVVARPGQGRAERRQPALVAQLRQPGPAQQRPQAPGCRAQSDRTCRDGGRRRGSRAAGGRRRRRATGRPCGRSARGRRRRRNNGSPCSVFPPEPDTTGHWLPPPACKPLKTRPIRRNYKCDLRHGGCPDLFHSLRRSAPCAKRGCPERPCGLRVCLLQCRKLRAIRRHTD